MKLNPKILPQLQRKLIWLSMTLFILTVLSCNKKSTALKYELQRKERIERAAKNISDAEAAAECFDMLNNAEGRIVRLEKNLFDSRDSTKKANRKIIVRTIEGTLIGAALGYIIGKF